MSKSKIIGWVIASPFILIAGGIAFCEANKAYWDSKVKELCEKDGGVTVYERVELTKEQVEKLGGFNDYIRAPTEDYARDFDEFISISNRNIIHDGYPYLYRTETTLQRRIDKKPLGKLINYGRVGGDFPDGLSNRSSYSCGSINGFNANLTKSVFIFKGE